MGYYNTRTSIRWNQLRRYCATLITLLFLWVVFPRVVFGQGSEWKVGETIGLRAGTCIRQGPGFNFPAHTQVPEDNWTVKVIDGPRTANGLVWWDTSRREAGDPSGGTGWVAQEQTDTDCFASVSVQPAAPPGQAAPITLPDIPNSADYQGWLSSLQAWWFQQSSVVKLGIAAVVIVIASSLWRFVGGILMGLIAAVVSSAVLWLILDFTRPVWSDSWYNLAQPVFGGDAPDLAMLVALLPLVSWAISAVRQLLRARL